MKLLTANIVLMLTVPDIALKILAAIATITTIYTNYRKAQLEVNNLYGGSWKRYFKETFKPKDKNGN